MLIPRIIPCLLVEDGAMVQTRRFSKRTYLGDPVNVINLFNQFEVDEIVLLDIGATACAGGAFADRLRPMRDVNSYHDLGASALAGPLRVVARADDGTIEAIEHPDGPIAGIMWHPERAGSPSEPDLDLLAWFFGKRPGNRS